MVEPLHQPAVIGQVAADLLGKSLALSFGEIVGRHGGYHTPRTRPAGGSSLSHWLKRKQTPTQDRRRREFGGGGGLLDMPSDRSSYIRSDCLLNFAVSRTRLCSRASAATLMKPTDVGSGIAEKVSEVATPEMSRTPPEVEMF